MSVVVIINPVSGGRRPTEVSRRVALASSLLAARGETGEVSVTEYRGHARELAAAARRARLVIAWGGDGTVNEVACALAFGSTPLGIVPAGSGNGLARTLGLPWQPERAMAEALESEPRPIDVGELGGRLFVSLAGIGFDAHVAARFGRGPSGRRGLMTYARVAARELLTYEAAAYRIEGDTQATTRALFVTIANGQQFGNGARVAPSARVDDGQLDLVVFEERSRLASLCAIPRLFTGGIGRVRGIRSRRIERVTITADHAMDFHVDGEPVAGGTRLEARVHPAALRVAAARRV